MLTRCKKRRRKKQAFRRIYLQRGTNNTWCLCGEYNSISSKTFLINAQVDASPFSWEEISNILTGMRRMYRFNSPSRSTSFLAKKEKEKNQRVDELSTLPTVTRVLFGKNRRIISRFENSSFELCRSPSFFLSRPIARTDKIGEKRKTSEGGNGR